MAFDRCSSCSAPLVEEGWTSFECPGCTGIIYRCHRCRQQSVPYECKKCGFRGP